MKVAKFVPPRDPRGTEGGARRGAQARRRGRLAEPKFVTAALAPGPGALFAPDDGAERAARLRTVQQLESKHAAVGGRDVRFGARAGVPCRGARSARAALPHTPLPLHCAARDKNSAGRARAAGRPSPRAPRT